MNRLATLLCSALLLVSAPLHADDPSAASAKPVFDAALAQKLGADARGMRHYMLVVLKTGPKRMPDGPARDAMFAGHFANINRLAEAGQLAVAGPFGKGGDWRGLFVLAVKTVEEADKLVASDPVIREGEMVAEFHPWYGSAALMQVPELHQRLAAPSP